MGNNDINITARINRHLRILRKSGKSPQTNLFGLSYSKLFVLFFIVFLFPIYPSLSLIVYKNTEYDFYRGNIDESSILESYIYTGGGNVIDGNVESFVSVNTILGGERDTSGSSEIIEYTIKPGESYELIAENFGISVNTILWANDFNSNHVLHPGDIVKIPPVTGVIYKIKKGDTLEKIAYKYNLKVKDIEKQNSISRNGIIITGRELILPGAEKIISKPKMKTKKTYAVKKSINSKKTYNNKISKKTSSENGSYKLVWRETKRNFAWGNCTYFVSHYKNVTWRGNANQWIKNARAKGVPTGSVARPGSIVQFSGRGYNPYYGHVGIVTNVNGSKIIVADMNYRAVNEVTYREVSIYDKTIDGYIYAD